MTSEVCLTTRVVYRVKQRLDLLAVSCETSMSSVVEFLPRVIPSHGSRTSLGWCLVGWVEPLALPHAVTRRKLQPSSSTRSRRVVHGVRLLLGDPQSRFVCSATGDHPAGAAVDEVHVLALLLLPLLSVTRANSTPLLVTGAPLSPS